MNAKVASALVTALWMLGGTMGVGLAASPAIHAHPGHSQECQEDQDCWDCSTMGNRVCGHTH